MGLLNKFISTLIRRTPVERKNVAPEVHRHIAMTGRSHTGTKAQRRKRRRIAHESRRVNFQKDA